VFDLFSMARTFTDCTACVCEDFEFVEPTDPRERCEMFCEATVEKNRTVWHKLPETLEGQYENKYIWYQSSRNPFQKRMSREIFLYLYQHGKHGLVVAVVVRDFDWKAKKAVRSDRFFVNPRYDDYSRWTGDFMGTYPDTIFGYGVPDVWTFTDILNEGLEDSFEANDY